MLDSMYEGLDSEYYGAESLFVTNTSDMITAYVEDLEDQIFWKDLFERFAPFLNIDFSPGSQESSKELEPTKNRGKTGKQEVLKQKDQVGKNLILCIDSDFQYLLKDKTIDHPCIFQTFTYSIENHKCAPQNLRSRTYRSRTYRSRTYRSRSVDREVGNS